MEATFSRLLRSAKQFSYFDPILSSCGKAVLNLRAGHSGSPLRERIKGEWLRSNAYDRDVHVRLYADDEDDPDDRLRKALENERPPIGIARSFVEKRGEDSFSIERPENAYFNFISTPTLSSAVVLFADDAPQYFHYWQRFRKLWWKKISSNPGRFKLAELEVLSDDSSWVNIYAEFPWGNQHLETVSLESFSDTGNKPLKKVSNKMSLDVATIALYCDAFHEDALNDSVTLQLNRKITPYRCILGIRETDNKISDELSKLALHLSRQLKKASLTTIFLSDCGKVSIDQQFKRNDEWGIPYTIVLDANTLKTGVIGLRNRDTTLEEEVHVSDLTNYVVQLFAKT